MENTMQATATPSANATPLAGLYRACGTVGNAGMPGAPILHYSLLVDAPTGAVSGVVHITQAIAGSGSNISVNVKGQIRGLGFGPITKLVSLEGEYVQSVPPPAIGSYLGKLTAHLAVDNNWNGRGGFEYGPNHVEDVPVKPTDC
jgi:hypothetical protein